MKVPASFSTMENPVPTAQLRKFILIFFPSEETTCKAASGLFGCSLSGLCRVDFWLPSSTVLNRSTYFLPSTPDTTLTIPSTASMAVAVGAYNGNNNTFADFSGRGFTRVTSQVKPDLVAPGVNLMAPKNGGGYEAVTGTSFATPMVSGAAALLMQWGIVEGNDGFLYGEKLKAYLIQGARQMPGYEVWPNPQMGWGMLCVRDSLPI